MSTTGTQTVDNQCISGIRASPIVDSSSASKPLRPDQRKRR